MENTLSGRPSSTCPICKSKKHTPLQTIKQRTIQLCQQCKHMFWTIFPGTDAELQAYYQQRYAEDYGQIPLQKSNLHYYRTHANYILENTPPDGLIVDFGCAYPVLLRCLKQKVRQIKKIQKTPGKLRLLGIDYDQVAHAYAKRHGIPMITPDLIDTQIDDHSIHFFRASHVLEHLIDPVSFLKRIYPKMAENGLLYMTQPNFPILKKNFSGWLQDTTYPEHLHFFSAYSIYYLLQSCGFVVETLVSHTEESRMASIYNNQIDMKFIKQKAHVLTEFDCEDGFLTHGRYPYYYGRNSFILSRKKDPDAFSNNLQLFEEK